MIEGSAAGIIKDRKPTVGGFFCIAVIRTAKHERGNDEGARVTLGVGEYQLPGHTETVTNPGVVRRERVLAQFHQHTATAQLFVELIKVGARLLIATEQERIKVQNAADGLVRGVPVITVDERELETVNADSRRESGNLLGNGGVAETSV